MLSLEYSIPFSSTAATLLFQNPLDDQLGLAPGRTFLRECAFAPFTQVSEILDRLGTPNPFHVWARWRVAFGN